MKSLDRSYRLFGVMKEAANDLREGVSKVRSLRGYTHNDKRLFHKIDGKEFKKVFLAIFIVRIVSLRCFSKSWLNRSKMGPINITEI